MHTLSKWIIGFGLLLVVADVGDLLARADLGMDRLSPWCGWAIGLTLVAAGLAADQRRRSLRMGGQYAALFISLALSGIYAWDAAARWNGTTAGMLSAKLMLTTLALMSIGMVWLIVRLRPRDGIASRGYAVALSSPRPGGASSQHAARRRVRRQSEAG